VTERAVIPESTPGQVIWAPDTYPVPGQAFGAGADASGRVLVLQNLFAKLGHPEVLQASRRHLERVSALNLETVTLRDQAKTAWLQARAAFLDGHLQVEEYLDAAAQAQRWFPADPADAAPNMIALVEAQRDLRARAAASLPAESSGLYQLAQRAAKEAVEATAAQPKLPDRCWSAPDPAAVAMELGAEQTYLELQRQQARFALCHQIGGLLRQVGGLGAEIHLPGGVPESVGFTFVRWDLGLEGDYEVRRLKPPLRLRWAVDHGWKPGLYLASDIRYPAEGSQPAAPRKFLPSWVGR
jgi:hypothetical protein